METTKKKAYEKPGIVFDNHVTGELTGTPELIDKILRENAEMKVSSNISTCPLEAAPCGMRGTIE